MILLRIDRFWKENPEVIGLKSLATYQPPNLVNNVMKNAMPTTTPPSPTTNIKHMNNVPPPPGANLNSMKDDAHSTKSRESDTERMQCESERICRR